MKVICEKPVILKWLTGKQANKNQSKYLIVTYDSNNIKVGQHVTISNNLFACSHFISSTWQGHDKIINESTTTKKQNHNKWN